MLMFHKGEEMQKTGSRLRVVTALAATVLLGTGALTGCSSDDRSPTAGTDAGHGAAATASSESSDHQGMGTPVKGDGATVLLTSAHETDKLELNAEYQGHADEYGDTTRPRNGGKFVVVTGTVTNDGLEDVRPCSASINTRLTTTPDASYEPVDQLFQFEGNEGCMDNLGPGFDREVTWVFMIPKDRKARSFGFSNAAMHSNDLTYIALDKFGQKSPATGKQPSPTTGTPAGDSGDTGTSSDAITGDTGGDPNPTADPGTGPASAPDSAASDNVSPAADPVIGFTGAPSVDSPHVLDKEIAGCGDPALHQTGTTFFTDGTSGWTESCAAQMG
jgi:hypothetical protein